MQSIKSIKGWSFYDWERVAIHDKEPEGTTILQKSDHYFNKLAHSPLPQQPVSTSRLVQDFNKRKWFTKESAGTQKCLIKKKKKKRPHQEKLALYTI